MKCSKHIFIGLLLVSAFVVTAQYVTDPLPYAAIANPLPDTMDQLRRDSFNLKFSPIRLNQAGYRPQDKKYFYYVGSGASNFTIIDASGKNAGSGSLQSTGKSTSGQLKIKCSNNAQLVSGGDTRYLLNSPVFSGSIYEGSIPDLAPGTYRVVVGKDTSAKFVVNERIYSWVRDALMKFYGVNRCGDSKSWFHPGCHLKDEVTGGWHDCGDHLKEGATMSYTAAVLGLAAAVFSDRDVDVYSADQGITQVTDGIPDILYEAKHGADFVLRSYDKAGGQVGKMITSMGGFGNTGCGDDHQWWGRPEYQDKMPANRGGPPRCARSEPTSDYLGKYAANLAFVSKMYKPYDAAYATRCLTAAKAIYDFTKPKLDKTNTAAYNGSTIVTDDVAFGALALLWATSERKYLDDLCFDKTIGTKASATPILFQGGLFTNNDPLFSKTNANTDWASCQTHVLWGFFRLILEDKSLCEKLGLKEDDRKGLIEKTMVNLMANLCSVAQIGTEQINLPPGCNWVPSIVHYELPWFLMSTQMEWVWNRYQAGNITDMYYYYDIATRIEGMELPNTPASAKWKPEEIKTVLVRMMDYMFGVNPWDISMVYGVGTKNFNHPHHRAANPEGKNVPGAFYKYCPPVGALQGGFKPAASGTNLYDEFYNDYMHAETGIDGTTNILMPVLGLAKQDTIGPPEGTVRIVYVGCDKAIIEIRQSRYGDAAVRYGKSVTTEKTVPSDSSGVIHRITLTGLTEGTAYKFDVVVKDVFGRESILKNINEERQEIDFTFTTLQNCPTNADIANVKVCKVTSDSAEIFWYTPNGEFDSKVVYGTEIPPTKVQDGDFSGHPTKFHYVKIGGLKEKTKYYFYVESGTSRDDNNGQYYTFTTPVEFVKFDVRTSRYTWSDKPALGVNIVNQDTKAYDSLELRLYFRDKEGFENDLGARIDIMVLYREDGFQDTITGDLRRVIWANLATQKPTKIPDTYNASDGTYAYYFAIPFWGVQMRSLSRIRCDIVFVRWEPTRHQDLLDEAPAHKITDKDWSFGPHSKANGDPVDYPGAPILPKTDVDDTYFQQPINYYVTIYRKNEYVWGYSPSKAELATKKTHFELKTQVTSPINNPNADYYLYEGSAKSILVKGYATLTPIEGKINDIWVNGVRLANPSSMLTWNQATQQYDFSIPVPVKNGRNLVDVTIFAGPDENCQECFGCAVTNHSFYLDAPFIQQYPSQIAIKDQNMNSFGDTVKVDTTQFHIIVTDKNGNVNKKGKDSLIVSVYNPSNGDSIAVTVIETADSSNVFQTVTPIKVVNLPPAQSNKNQIAMGGAEKVVVTYIDPSDPTDTSKAVLYSRAEFPIPLTGWLYDSDGNGSVDKVVILYNQKIKDNPDSVQIAFPGATTLKMLKKPSDSFTMDDKREAVVIGTPIEKTTGFTSGVSGNATAYIVTSNRVKGLTFTLKDSAGPVLVNNAVLKEREGAGDDTITVTFSEAVSIDHLTGNVLLLRKSGKDYPVKVNTIKGIESGIFTITLIVQCGEKIEGGDSLLIDPAGALDDLSANKAHAKNKPVVVMVKEAPAQLVNACYRDLNADGAIDRIDIVLSKAVNVSDCEFSINWNNKKDNVSIGNSTAKISSDNPKMVQVSVNGSQITGQEIATGGVMMVTIVHKNFGKTNAVKVADSAAPVLTNATFKKSVDSDIDTLDVEYSEAVDVSSDDAFLLWSVQDGKQYSFVCSDKGKASGFAQKTMIVTKTVGVESAFRNDSIWIRPDAGIKDMNGNAQSNPLNKRVLLKIGQIPLNIKIISGPNPFEPGISKLPTDQDIPEKIKNKKGFLIRVSLSNGKAGKLAVSDINGKIRIFDGMGNLIYTGILIKGANTEMNNYYFLWDGTNKRGRMVGTGTYIANLETESVVTDAKEGVQRRMDTIKIGVDRKSE
jgi:hypothetical protein